MADCRMFASPGTTIVTPPPTPSTPTSRLEALLKVLHELPSDAFILLFAQNDASLARLLPTAERLHGTSAVRARVLLQFRTGVFRVLLLNSDLSSAGIHVPETTDVIFYHEMDIHVQQQAIARAHRLGRQGVLRVHHIRNQA